MRVSICVSTYGEERWADLARARAIPSAVAQGALEIVFTHMPEGSAALARNGLLVKSLINIHNKDGGSNGPSVFEGRIERREERDEAPQARHAAKRPQR